MIDVDYYYFLFHALVTLFRFIDSGQWHVVSALCADLLNRETKGMLKDVLEHLEIIF